MIKALSLYESTLNEINEAAKEKENQAKLREIQGLLSAESDEVARCN